MHIYLGGPFRYMFGTFIIIILFIYFYQKKKIVPNMHPKSPSKNVYLGASNKH
jgi:hypothetical protein